MTISQIVCCLITIATYQLFPIATTLSVKSLILATWDLLKLTKYEIYLTLYSNHFSRSVQVIIFHEQNNYVQTFGFQVQVSSFYFSKTPNRGI